MKIYGNKSFSIFIHESDHPPPHCHVRFADETVVCVSIPFIEPMYGTTISHKVRNIIEEYMDDITDAWDKFHPKRI